MIQKGRQTGIYFTSLPTFLRRIRKAFKECLVFAPINRGRINSAIKIRSSSISSSSFSWDFALVCGLHGNLQEATRSAASQITIVSVVRIVFVIPIHAPREGSDKVLDDGAAQLTNFNPRSPRGERRLQRPT